MQGIIEPKEGVKIRQCMLEIYDASKESPVYSETEKRQLTRYSKLKRRFTSYEANAIYLIHARIPREEKAEDEPQPWMDKKVRRKREFFEVK